MSTTPDSQGQAQDPFATVEIDPNDLYGRDGKQYLADPDLCAAANAALYLEMPLLLTGEPGCGKTHFAWAAAWGLFKQMHRGAVYSLENAPQPLICQVRSDSRARDLLYQYDAIRRFGDAQHGGDIGKLRASDARQYIELGGLGRALMDQGRLVVLIDEIDKAQRDLPNDLLNELDFGDFEIPEIPASLPPEVAHHLPAQVDSYGIPLRRKMERPSIVRSTPARRSPKPLVIITSNVERQLPDAFLRRCVFFHIDFPDRGRLTDILLDHLRDSLDRLNRPGRELLAESRRFLTDKQQRKGGLGSARSALSECAQAFLEAIVDILLRLRSKPLTKRPATAELIAWCRALLGSTLAERQLLAVLSVARALLNENSDSELALGTLPQAGCLIKLREDWERLRARHTAQ